MPAPVAPPRNPVTFQTPQTAKTRADHIWFQILGFAPKWKCCLCGAITAFPPKYPTPKEWKPDGYELPLTKEERSKCPYLSVIVTEKPKVKA